MANKPQALTLPLLITRALVVFPGNQQLIEAGRDFSISAVNASKNECDSLILVTSQRDFNKDNPTADDVFDVGVLCRIISVSERDNRLKVRIEVMERVKLTDVRFEENAGYYSAIGGMNPLPSLQLRMKPSLKPSARRLKVFLMFFPQCRRTSLISS